MTDEQLRNVVAAALEPLHGNPDFIRSIRDGGQDDGPYMVAAFAVNAAWLAAPEAVE